MCARSRFARVESLETRRLLSVAIAFLDNSSYVDTSATEPAATAANLQQELVQLGYNVKPFNGIDATSVQQALQGAKVLVIPSLINGDLDSVMSNTAKTEIQSFLSNGGGLIVSGDAQDRDTNFLSDTFNLPALPAEIGQGVTGSAEYNLNAAGSAETAFASGAATIGNPETLRNINTINLPANAREIYVGGYYGSNATAVCLLPYANKLPIAYLSYDWANGGPNGALDSGWNQALNLAVEQLTAPAATITTLTAFPTSITAGNSVQLTASVTLAIDGGTAPTGTVTFKDGSTSVGTAALQSNGTAVLSITSLPVGTDTITASYGGDANSASSTSAAVTVNVSVSAPAASVTTLHSSAISVVTGTAVTFTATVAPATSGPTPTGTVSFVEGGTTVGSDSLEANGTAVFTTTLTAGSDSVTAVYSGSATYATSTSSAVVEEIEQGTPNVTLTSSSTSISLGMPVTLTANVAPTVSGNPTPTGSVRFIEDGNIVLGVATLVRSTATLSTSNLVLGTDTVIAIYIGDGNYVGANSAALTEHVTPQTANGSVTTLSASAATASPETPITFSATVSLTGGATPSGTVTFLDNGATLGSAVIGAGGIATFSTPSLVAGMHNITASYSGGGGYTGSQSATVSVQIVNVGSDSSATTTTLTTSATSVAAGASVTFTATVSSTAGGGIPTGSVYFIDGGAALGSATIQSDGTAQLTTSALPTGNSNVTANYSGDNNFSQSTSTQVAETVAPPTSSAVPNLGKVILPESAIAGGKFVGRLPVVVANSGNTLSGRFTIRLYFSTGAMLDSNAVAISSMQKKLILADNTSKTLTANIKSLPTLADGDYYLLMEVIDPTGAVSVSATSTTVHVAAPFVSLSASVGAITPALLPAGKSGSVVVAVTNAGNTNASGLLHLTLGLSADGQTALAGGALTTTSKRITLKPGKSHSFRIRFKVPAAVAASTYYPFLTVSLAGVSTTTAGSTSFTIG